MILAFNGRVNGNLICSCLASDQAECQAPWASLLLLPSYTRVAARGILRYTCYHYLQKSTDAYYPLAGQATRKYKAEELPDRDALKMYPARVFSLQAICQVVACM